LHYTRVCRHQARQSTTLKIARQHVELGQPPSRQPVSHRRLAAVSPHLRQRDLPADAAGAHEYRVRPTALHIQDLKPLPPERMERVRDDNETQEITGRYGTMPPPSESPICGASPIRRAWGSCVPAPAAERTSRP